MGAAQRDNDIIYHEAVTPEHKLTPLQKKSMVLSPLKRYYFLYYHIMYRLFNIEMFFLSISHFLTYAIFFFLRQSLLFSLDL